MVGLLLIVMNISALLSYAGSNNVCIEVSGRTVLQQYLLLRACFIGASIMFQLLASRIIDDVIEDEMRRWDHVDNDVIAEKRHSAFDAQMTSQEIQQLVDAHNARRRSVGATNMELMVHTHNMIVMFCEN